MGTPDSGAPTGALIPCEKCGQAVADYRGTCPFCGAPTGRPELPPPSAAPAPEEAAPQGARRSPLRGLVILVIVVACVAAFAGCVALINSNNKKNTEVLSPEAAAFLHKAMPALDGVLSEYQAGDDTQAANDFSAIGDMPALTPMDLKVAKRYTAYSNAVRGYLLEEGSVSLQQVEAARSATKSAIAESQAE
jgi:hypothetical protein